MRNNVKKNLALLGLLFSLNGYGNVPESSVSKNMQMFLIVKTVSVLWLAYDHYTSRERIAELQEILSDGLCSTELSKDFKCRLNLVTASENAENYLYFSIFPLLGTLMLDLYLLTHKLLPEKFYPQNNKYPGPIFTVSAVAAIVLEASLSTFNTYIYYAGVDKGYSLPDPLAASLEFFRPNWMLWRSTLWLNLAIAGRRHLKMI